MSRDSDQDWRGLRMLRPPDAEVLARERAVLSDLATRPFASRARGYLRLLGPGYLQSAMTLGGGTVSAATRVSSQSFEAS